MAMEDGGSVAFVMNDQDSLVRVLEFILVGGCGNENNNGSDPNHTPGQKHYILPSSVPPRPVDRTVSNRIRRGCFAIANLRCVNKHWRDTIDGSIGSKLWFQVAERLDLDPPPQLYADATGTIASYQHVCKLLLASEEQREAILARGRLPDLGWKTACRMHRPRPYQQHPLHKEPLPFPCELRERIAKNAMELKSFLGAVHCFWDETSRKRKRKKTSSTRIRLNSFDESESDGEADEDESHGRFDDDEIDDDNAKMQSFDAMSALNRYRMFLFLRKAHPNTWFVPTVDIEFCWLAHIFRTEMYWKDMTALGIDPRHSLCLPHYGQVAGFAAALQGTAALWESTFHLAYLPPNTDLSWKVWSDHRRGRTCNRIDPNSFFPTLGTAVATIPATIAAPHIGLTHQDVQADLSWFPELKCAFSDMNREAFDVLRWKYERSDMNQNNNILLKEHLIPSYERFLNLCNDTGNKRLIESAVAPPYAIDLIWHAHQLDPVAYKEDCLALFGREFWHHPWPNGPGVSAPVSDELLCAWKTKYGTAMESDWKLSMEGDEEESESDGSADGAV